MRKNFDFYAYTATTDGYYFVNGVRYFAGEDFRNVKRYKEYKNAGFNVLLLQHENSYNGEDFESSACNKCMENAYKAGIDKIIVSDKRLKDLCIETQLVGKNARFETQTQLEEYIEFCISPYKNKKGFYGVQLYDEPHGSQLKTYGIVVKTLKKMYPEMYLQCNLLPCAGKEWLADESNDDLQAYEKYLNSYVDLSGTDNILFDEYPFRRKFLLGGYSLPTYQIASRVCKERRIEMRAVLQSMCSILGGNYIHRRVIKQDMLWQTNLAMGFGAREFSFFTYFTKPVNVEISKINIDSIDGSTFINRDGTRTKLYYFTKDIIKRMKKFSKSLLKFQYDNCYFTFEKGKTNKDFPQTEFALINESCPIKTDISYGVMLITVQTNKNEKLYTFENLGNIKDELDGKPMANVMIEIPKTEKIIKTFVNGKPTKLKIKNNVINQNLGVGNAIYVRVKV